MKNNNDSELEKLETWDTNQVETRQPQKSSRVVFSVAFSRDDFNQISKHAELIGKKTSEFIREAVIEKISIQGNQIISVNSYGSLGTIWTVEQTPPITMVSGYKIEHPEEVPSFTS